MRNFLALFFLLLSFAVSVEAQQTVDAPQSAVDWKPYQAENLMHWIRRADDEAISIPAQITEELRTAIDAGDREGLNEAANTAAMRLLQAYRGMCCSTQLPASWHISQSVSDAQLHATIDSALAADQVDLMLRTNRPAHPHYRLLAQAYASEPAEARRSILALNLARWRSILPRANGRYLIVNAAAQELTLWEGDTQVDHWRVIVGKASSPTPVFSAEVTGVVLNPWWEIPTSIAAEGIGAFVRRNPAAARARGYIYDNGRYRQMPGDNNALGRMKLVMPNRFSVLLHDTSNRELFARDDRTLSHGCVRVDRALQFAQTLLSEDSWEQQQVDEKIASGDTVTVSLTRSVPLFVAYFTVTPIGEEGIRFLPDVYNRDGSAALPLAAVETECAMG